MQGTVKEAAKAFETDLEMWKQWRKDPSEENKTTLLKQIDPIVHREVNRWSAGSIPRFYLVNKARNIALEAMDTFNPKMDTRLSTHVTNRLKKLSRVVYTHQQIARVPEYKTLKTSTYMRGINILKDTLGREPTTEEISDELGWSPAYTKEFLGSGGARKELLETGEAAAVFGRASVDPTIDYIYHGMDPTDKKIFEYSTGYGGAEELGNEEICKKLKITQGQLSYRKRQLIDQIKKVY